MGPRVAGVERRSPRSKNAIARSSDSWLSACRLSSPFENASYASRLCVSPGGRVAAAGTSPRSAAGELRDQAVLQLEDVVARAPSSFG